MPTSQTLGEVFRAQGEGGPYAGAPFTLEAETDLRVSWEQSGAGEFLLLVVKVGPAAAGAPDGEVLFEFAVGPSRGSGEHLFGAGEYVVEVQSDGGPWEVWVEAVRWPDVAP